MSHILIVEDNESLRLAYTNILEQEGYEVTGMPRVLEALTYLETNTPDLILLDMFLPVMNGLELLQRYDIKEAHKEVKVIAFSNLTEVRIEQEARDLGVSLYLTKSLTDPKQLIENIKGVLGS